MALVAIAAAFLAGPSQGAPPGARVAACDWLGAADRFAVFSDGVFTAAAGGGTTINGRVAAAGDVTLDGVTLTGSAPAVVTGPTSSPAGRPGRAEP